MLLLLLLMVSTAPPPPPQLTTRYLILFVTKRPEGHRSRRSPFLSNLTNSELPCSPESLFKQVVCIIIRVRCALLQPGSAWLRGRARAREGQEARRARPAGPAARRLRRTVSTFCSCPGLPKPPFLTYIVIPALNIRVVRYDDERTRRRSHTTMYLVNLIILLSLRIVMTLKSKHQKKNSSTHTLFLPTSPGGAR